jgi:hypothetical protein
MKPILLAIAVLLSFSAQAKSVNCDAVTRIAEANKLVGGKWFSTKLQQDKRSYSCGYSLTGGGGELLLQMDNWPASDDDRGPTLHAGTTEKLRGIGRSGAYFKETPKAKGDAPMRAARATTLKGKRYEIRITTKRGDEAAIKAYLVDTIKALAAK